MKEAKARKAGQGNIDLPPALRAQPFVLNDYLGLTPQASRSRVLRTLKKIARQFTITFFPTLPNVAAGP